MNHRFGARSSAGLGSSGPRENPPRDRIDGPLASIRVTALPIVWFDWIGPLAP